MIEVLRAAVFDMDGTLVDNMAFHNRAWEIVSERLGVPTKAERFQREFAGKKNEEIFPELLGRAVPPDELARLAEEKEGLYRATYRPHLALTRGADAFLERLRLRGVRLAIATAAPQGNRDFVLDGLRLRERFERVVGAEEVTRGKPAPDIFLRAARRRDPAPAACVVFEDAANGVRAAKAAGMVAVGITTATTAEELRDAGADWTAADFTSLPAALLERLGIV
ncbi:MAG TPA: HAD family phosphatase [Polyangium sp.]|nr:HAD family phosphatase [Polyangium sp.]